MHTRVVFVASFFFIRNMKSFFLKSKDILITISDVEKGYIEEIKSLLINKEKGLKRGIVAEEKHKTGKTHYHIFLQYEKYKYIRRFDYYNYLLNKQANIVKVNFQKQAIEYCKKNNNYVVFGEKIDNVYTNKKEALNKNEIERIVYSEIMNKKSIEDIEKHSLFEVRQYVLKHCSTLSKAYAFRLNCESNEQQKNKKGFKIDATKINNLNEKKIVEFLDYAQNIRYNRPFKSKNLHIYSRLSGVGKTCLLNRIRECAACYNYPPTQWFTHYKDKAYSFILWDEFSLKSWDSYFLNLFLEGSPVDLPIKFSVTTKTDNPLVIMCSNQSLREQILRKFRQECFCYRHLIKKENSDILCTMNNPKCKTNSLACTVYNTLMNRIVEIEIKENENLFNLVDSIMPN